MNDLNKVLHEKVMGECWHEGIEWDNEGYGTCGKCHATDFFNSSIHAIRVSFEHPDYIHDPDAYWRLLQKVKTDKNFSLLLLNLVNETSQGVSFGTDDWIDIIQLLLDQQRGCEAIADFFIPDWRS